MDHGQTLSGHEVFETKSLTPISRSYLFTELFGLDQRNPLTSQHFEDFFKRMPKREDSEKSWTVDLIQRRKDARKESAPLQKQAESKSRQADAIKVQLMAMTKETDDYKTLENREKELRRDARELKSRAQAIDDAVYDLKAVNPNSIVEEDTRTPEDLLNIIEQKGREVAEALSALRGL